MGTQSYDVIIVGAGAAGCAAAMNTPAGAKVLMIDRGLPGRSKCCGGLLAPDAQDALARSGLLLPEHVRVKPEPHSVHVRDLDSGLEQTYRRDYRNIDRARFDAWMLELAKERAAFRDHAKFAGLGRTDRGFLVRVLHMGEEETLSTRVVIAADGARSGVRRSGFPGLPVQRTAVAIQASLPAGDVLEAHEVFFSSRLTDFYAWAIPKSGEVLIGSAFDRARGAHRRFETLCRVVMQALGLSGEIERVSARQLTRPRAPGDLLAGKGGILLAGEAAGLISPSSGEGLSFAIESGAAAGRAVGAASPIETYWPAFRHLARRVRRKFVKARVIFSPVLRRLALRLPWCP